MSFIKATELKRQYGKGESAVMALRGVSFNMTQGEFVAVMGPSGSGKSTLLAVMGGLGEPTSGFFQVDGIDVFALTSDQRADFRREYLGFVFQDFNLMPYLDLQENVMLPLATKRMAKREKRELAAEALARVGLADKLARLPSQCSGGEQERAALARALVNRPPILLADEPTGNLDAANSRIMMEMLQKLGAGGMTIAMVTHSAECAQYSQRVLVMEDGRRIPGPEKHTCG